MHSAVASQQSASASHLLPWCEQSPGGPQIVGAPSPFGLQLPEQQSAPELQSLPSSLQGARAQNARMFSVARSCPDSQNAGWLGSFPDCTSTSIAAIHSCFVVIGSGLVSSLPYVRLEVKTSQK